MRGAATAPADARPILAWAFQAETPVRHPVAFRQTSTTWHTCLREDICDGFVVGGGASAVLRQAAVAHEANKPFWLQLVGTGLTTAFALHLGAVCTHAQWPAVTCLNVYATQLVREPIPVQGGYCQVPESHGQCRIPDVVHVGSPRNLWDRSQFVL